MFRRTIGQPDVVPHLDRIEGWVRGRFDLGPGALVMVLEGEGRLPGYPPRETTVLFWTDPGTRHRLRLFKAAEAVTEEDLPVRWLLPTLVDDGDGECC